MIKWIFRAIGENIKYLPQSISIAKADLKRQYHASDLGIFWAVAKPMMYLLMFYFALSFGFKNNKDIADTVCPYFIWLGAGIVQWRFISGLLVGGSSCFYRRRSVIKGSKFPLLTVPMITIFTRVRVWLITIVVVMGIAILMGVKPSVYWLQLPIYMVLTIMFLYVWVLMTALMNIVSADILEFIKTIRSAFFWLSGILFNIKGRPSPIYTYNPISYLVQGFRNAFAFHIWIWEEKRLFLKFAIVMLILSAITYFLYKKLEKKLPELL